MEAPACQIYLVSPPTVERENFIPQLTEALESGKVAAFQLRLKEIEPNALEIIAAEVTALCHSKGVPCLINDNPVLAKKIDAAGVHLGKDDAVVEEARKILGEHKQIGVSCYDDVDRALDLANRGADYVSFGAFYPTKTKKTSATPTTEMLQWWRRNTVVPSVAIGGITAKNAPPLVEAGADFLAVISFVWEHPEGVAKALNLLAEAIMQRDKS